MLHPLTIVYHALVLMILLAAQDFEIFYCFNLSCILLWRCMSSALFHLEQTCVSMGLHAVRSQSTTGSIYYSELL